MKKKILSLLVLLPFIAACDISSFLPSSGNNTNHNSTENGNGSTDTPANNNDNQDDEPSNTEEPGNNDNNNTDDPNNDDNGNSDSGNIDDNNNDNPNGENVDNPDNGDNNNTDNPDNGDTETPIEQNHKDDEIEKGFLSGNKLFDAFFTYGKKIHIDLSFTNQSLLKLAEYGEPGNNNSNFVKNEMYHPCTMKVTMDNKTATYYEVGARMRGNTSRNTNFITRSGYFVPGENFHFKLNFAQTFDNAEDNDYYINPWTNSEKRKERDDRKFGKMKKLDFKWNRNYDGTFTKELYVLDAFRNEGVLAQHGNLVEVTINSEVDSRTMVYQVLESVDKQLIKKAYPDDNSGDLYKCLYQNSPADLTNTNYLGVETTGFRPTYGLKTNEDKSDMSVIKTFINNVKLKTNQDGYTSEMYYENISRYMDVDNFLKYSALCWLFGLPDDLRNNANNYYLYFNKEGKALFLPYDNDRCLGIRKDWDKDLRRVAWDDPYGQGYNEFNKCPLILRLITGGSNNSYTVHQPSKDQYHQYCIDYVERYLDLSRFELFTRQFEGIAPSVDISNSGESNDTFSSYATIKKEMI